MSELTLAAAKNKYPTALYSYMRIMHLRETMQAFLADPEANPVFAYGYSMTIERAEQRLQTLVSERAAATDDGVRTFLTHRIIETEQLCRFLRLRTAAPSAAALQTYRECMAKLYGPLNPDYFAGALTRLHTMAQEQRHEAALRALAATKFKSQSLFAPPAATFKRYRVMLEEYLPAMFTPLTSDESPHDAIKHQLDMMGLAARGWRVRTVRHATNVSVSRHGKTVNIGDNYRPATPFRLQQIIAHEIYGHTRRFDYSGYHASPKEEEGIAIVYEQLLAKRFMYKRMLRYVAICLSWGIDGVPRDFVTTYHLMVPLVEVATGKTGQIAQEIAFKETLRAYRGGNPSVPGMVLTKDKVYMESNLAVWRHLTDTVLGEAAFRQFLDGTDAIERNMQ